MIRACSAPSLVALCVLAIALTLLHVESSHAQDAWTKMLAPDVPRSEFERILPSMHLQPQEDTIIRALYDSFLSEFTEASARAKAQMEALAPEAQRDRDDVDYGWWENRLKLEDQFESDVKATLSGESAIQAWWHAMAAVRRHHLLNYLHSYANVREAYDLIGLLDQIGLTDPEKAHIADDLAAYEQQMDDQLRSYQSERAPFGRATRSPQPGGLTHEQFQKLMPKFKAWQDLQGNFGKTNAEYAARIAPKLDTHREGFLDAINRFCYPELFHPTPAQLAIEAIRLAPDIPPEKRQTLETIWAQSQAVNEQMNRQIIETVKQWQSGNSPLKREMAALAEQYKDMPPVEYWQRQDELEQQHPVNPLMRRRHDLALEAVRQMRAVFSDHEFQQLPLAIKLCLSSW